MRERVAYDLGLLVDFLGHEMAVVALFREQAAGGAADDAALDGLARHFAEFGPGAGDNDPVALLEIGDPVGERGERERVGAEVHFALAVADRERRALPRANQQVLLALEEIDEREGAAQPLQRGVHRFGRALPRRHFVGDEDGGDFGVGFGGEAVALGGEFLTKRLEVLDDAVVDDGEAVARVRVGIALGRLAVGRPTGVADADGAAERVGAELGLQVFQLALGAQARQAPVLKCGYAGGVVAPVFQPLQGGDDLGRNRPMTQNADDSTHEATLATRFVPSKG